MKILGFQFFNTGVTFIKIISVNVLKIEKEQTKKIKTKLLHEIKLRAKLYFS
jgi:hypothetical protein